MSGTPCHCMKLRRASSAITKMYDRCLEPSGLTVNQFAIMKNIQLSAPVSVSDLAVKTQLDRTTMVRNLRPLEEQGMVEDVSEPGTRNRQLVLTKYGAEKLRYADPMWKKAQGDVKKALGESELAMLAALLLKVETICES